MSVKLVEKSAGVPEYPSTRSYSRGVVEGLPNDVRADAAPPYDAKCGVTLPCRAATVGVANRQQSATLAEMVLWYQHVSGLGICILASRDRLRVSNPIKLQVRYVGCSPL